MKQKIIDPYGSELVEDYEKIINEFGLEHFPEFPDPNRLMTRGVIFAGRDLSVILKAMNEKKKYYVLSGIMPSAEKIHLGTKMVVENIRYFQEHNAKTFILIADLEANAARNISLHEARKRAFEFQIPSYLALGLDPKKTVFYFQSENTAVMQMAYEFSKKITLNEFKAIYGNADPARIFSALTQAADILYPQLEERMPGVIPVGVDQDCHIRLTRDIVNRSKEKKFFLPSSIYHKFTPSLDGSIKMSKSREHSFIELPEEEKSFTKKLKNSLTGGRDTIAEQKKLGGIPEKCMIFELYKQHLIEDDKKLKEIYNECKSGKLLCGEDKQNACEILADFMRDFNSKFEKSKKIVDKIHFIK